MPIYMNWGGDVDPPSPPKIRGNATDQDHPNWIELDSIQWGTPKRKYGYPQITEVVVTKRQDSASPLLFREAKGDRADGENVVIDFQRRDQRNSLLSLQLTNAIVSNISISSSGVESVTLNFTKIKWGTDSGITPHSTWPPPTVGWDLSVNRDLGD